MGEIWHLRHAGLGIVAVELLRRDVGFEPAAEIGGAHARVDDGQDDEDDGDNGEGGEGFANREIRRSTRLLVHADELEEEVGQAGEIEDLWRGNG